MRKSFEKLIGGGRVVSIIMALFGLVLLLWPKRTLELAAQIIGIGLLLGGILAGIAWYRNRDSVRASTMSMAEAIIGLAAGLFMLVAPRFVVGILPMAVGLLILANGVVNLAQAIGLKSAGGFRWKGPLVLAVVTVLLGILIVLNPFSAAAMTVAAIGAVLVYNGISNLIIGAKYRQI